MSGQWSGSGSRDEHPPDSPAAHQQQQQQEQERQQQQQQHPQHPHHPQRAPHAPHPLHPQHAQHPHQNPHHQYEVLRQQEHHPPPSHGYPLGPPHIHPPPLSGPPPDRWQPSHPQSHPSLPHPSHAHPSSSHPSLPPGPPQHPQLPPPHQIPTHVPSPTQHSPHYAAPPIQHHGQVHPDHYRAMPPPPMYAQYPPGYHPMGPIAYPTQPAPRQRTAIACRYCRRRKIRCSGFDTSEDGRCTNCQRFSQECVFTPVSQQNQAFVPAHTVWRNQGQPPQQLYGAYGQPLPPQHAQLPHQPQQHSPLTPQGQARRSPQGPPPPQQGQPFGGPPPSMQPYNMHAQPSAPPTPQQPYPQGSPTVGGPPLASSQHQYPQSQAPPPPQSQQSPPTTATQGSSAQSSQQSDTIRRKRLTEEPQTPTPGPPNPALASQIPYRDQRAEQDYSRAPVAVAVQDSAVPLHLSQQQPQPPSQSSRVGAFAESRSEPGQPVERAAAVSTTQGRVRITELVTLNEPPREDRAAADQVSRPPAEGRPESAVSPDRRREQSQPPPPHQQQHQEASPTGPLPADARVGDSPQEQSDRASRSAADSGMLSQLDKKAM